MTPHLKLIFTAASFLVLVSCSPAKAPPPPAASSSSAAPVAVALPADLTPYGKFAPTSKRAKQSVTRVEVRSEVGAGAKTVSAPDGTLYVVIEYMIWTPGIDATAIEPMPDIFLVNPAGEMISADQDLSIAYLSEPDYQERSDKALELSQHLLMPAVFKVPSATYRPGTWYLTTGTNVKFALQ